MGGTGSDRLDGGAGNDYLAGGRGADVYLFNRGSGQDYVWNYDDDGFNINADKVLLGAGVAPTDVILERSSYSLILKIANTTDQLTFENYFSYDAAGDYTVETIQFADGTVWDVDTVKAKVQAGTALYGSMYADITVESPVQLQVCSPLAADVFM